MIARLLILDTETTGTDPDAVCIEIAAALFDVRHASVISSYSTLLYGDSNAAEHINHIPPTLLSEGREPRMAWAPVAELARYSDVVVTHKVSFDRRFVPDRATLRCDGDGFVPLPWCCSCEDIEWPRAGTSRKLVDLALAHGLGVATAHRAAADVDLLCRLFTRAAEMGTDLQAMLARAMRPKVLVQAMVSYAENQRAKDAGFRWDGERRAWLRRIAAEDIAGMGWEFRTVVQP